MQKWKNAHHVLTIKVKGIMSQYFIRSSNLLEKAKLYMILYFILLTEQ